MRGLGGVDSIVDSLFAVVVDAVGDENNDVLARLLLQDLVRGEINRVIERSAATRSGMRFT